MDDYGIPDEDLLDLEPTSDMSQATIEPVEPTDATNAEENENQDKKSQDPIENPETDDENLDATITDKQKHQNEIVEEPNPPKTESNC